MPLSPQLPAGAPVSGRAGRSPSQAAAQRYINSPTEEEQTVILDPGADSAMEASSSQPPPWSELPGWKRSTSFFTLSTLSYLILWYDCMIVLSAGRSVGRSAGQSVGRLAGRSVSSVPGLQYYVHLTTKLANNQYVVGVSFQKDEFGEHLPPQAASFHSCSPARCSVAGAPQTALRLHAHLQRCCSLSCSWLRCKRSFSHFGCFTHRQKGSVCFNHCLVAESQ